MNEANHRVRVGAERRGRMREQLLHAALRLMATCGPEGAVIDDIVRAAGVSRGTFYKYYASPAALVRDLALRLADDMITTVHTLTRQHDDPALRAALGLRAILGLVAACPRLGGFISRAGWPVSDPSHAFFRVVAPNIDEGLASGRFHPRDRDLCLTLIGGISVGAMYRLTQGPVPEGFAEEAAEMVLAGLGLTAEEAVRLSRTAMVLPVPAPASLLARVMADTQG